MKTQARFTPFLPIALVASLFDSSGCATEAGLDLAETDGASPAALYWETRPPATLKAGTVATTRFFLDADAPADIAELRICSGAGVLGCGAAQVRDHGGGVAHDLSIPARLVDGVYLSDLRVDIAGPYTVVGYAESAGVGRTTAPHQLVVE